MESYILLLIGFLGVIISFRFQGILHKVISIGQLLTYVFALIIDQYNLFNISYLTLIALDLFLILMILTFIYGLIIKDIDMLSRISIALMGFFSIIFKMAKIFYFPGIFIFRSLVLVSVFVAIISFIKNKKLTKEMSFMLFWIAYSLLTGLT